MMRENKDKKTGRPRFFGFFSLIGFSLTLFTLGFSIGFSLTFSAFLYARREGSLYKQPSFQNYSHFLESSWGLPFCERIAKMISTTITVITGRISIEEKPVEDEEEASA